MTSVAPSIILASGSPRRLSLLQQLGLQVEVQAADIDESVIGDERAPEYVVRLASEKALKVASTKPQNLVIGADTAIEVDNRILGKPVDQADGVGMLQNMQGRSHSVYTGVAITGEGRIETTLIQTRVWLRSLTDAEINAYWATGEPTGKAGSYAIQGAGAVLVQRIEGCYFNVVGLPLHETSALLGRFGVSLVSILNGSSLLHSSQQGVR